MTQYTDNSMKRNFIKHLAFRSKKYKMILTLKKIVKVFVISSRKLN